MRRFTQILENNEQIDAKLTADHKELKQLLVKSSGAENVDDLKKSMADNVRAFRNETAVSLDGFRESEDLYKFWTENRASIDALLESGEWFTNPPSKSGIKGLKQYVIESVKFALSELCQQVLDDVSRVVVP